jgi:hypothetical protein
MTPSEWQAYVNQLAAIDAQLRGAVYQTVPDATHGDAGLEGFTTDGRAFQAYCPEEGKPAATVKIGICTKITNDLEKLYRYRDYWARALPNNTLLLWTLVVPTLRNREILAHAGTQAEGLRAKNLPFIAPAFQALVQTPRDFPQAMKRLSPLGDEQILIPEVHITDAVFQEFETERAAKVEQLDNKLRKLPTVSDDAKLNLARRQFLRFYLEYRNGLEWLAGTWPAARERIVIKQEGLRKTIELRSLIDPSQPPDRLKSAQLSFRKEIDQIAPYLESTQRDNMAWGVVTEWLLECNLDFSA